MKIAITGASGNLGSRIVRICLQQGHSVVGIDKAQPRAHPEVPAGAPKDAWRFIELDVRDYDQVYAALSGNDAVIHLAAIPNPGDYVHETHNLNVVSSWNVLRSSAELGIERICQASSINAIGMCWGDNPIIDYVPMDEKHPCRPEDPYSLSKLIAELQADTIIRRWPNMRIASIRLSWAVPNREFCMGREMEWVRKELFSWVDAEESARAFVLGVTGGDWTGHEAFFICAPDTCQDEDSLDLMREQWPQAEIRRQFVGNESLYDCSKAGRILGWYHKPTVPLALQAEPVEEAVPAAPEAAAPAPAPVEESLPAAAPAPVHVTLVPEPAPLTLAAAPLVVAETPA